MKKVLGVIVLVVIGLAIGLAITSSNSVKGNDSISADKQVNTNPEAETSNDDKSDEVVDLTTLSATMVYAEVYNMMMYPEQYEGKTIKMKGEFITFDNPATKRITTGCLIMDATACCSQGIEFVLAGDKVYPDDYPEVNSQITVAGVYETYEEKGQLYCRLVNAVLE